MTTTTFSLKCTMQTLFMLLLLFATKEARGDLFSSSSDDFDGSGGCRRLLANELDMDCLAETYDTFLVVSDVHLLVVSFPQDKETGCPTIGLHATRSEQHGGGLTKELLELREQDQRRKNDEDEINRLLLASGPLFELVDAFERTVVDETKAWDLVSNNCGTFFVDMMQNLGVPIDERATDFVTRRFMALSTDYWLDLLSENKVSSPFPVERYKMGLIRKGLFSKETAIRNVIEQALDSR